ncbi:MAG: hypothetical protein EOP59_07380, partial [Sphingomonadales bacterium]
CRWCGCRRRWWARRDRVRVRRWRRRPPRPVPRRPRPRAGRGISGTWPMAPIRSSAASTTCRSD